MELSVKTKITEVTIYPDRARVTRTGSAEIELNTQQLLIDDLPAELDVNSVRVMGKGSAKVTILGVDLRTTYHRETPDEQLRELETKFAALQDQWVVLSDEKTALEAEMGYLNGLRAATEQYARGFALARIQSADHISLLDTLQQRDAQIRQKGREVAIQQRELQKSIAQLQSQLDQARNTVPLQRYQAVIELSVSEAGSLLPQLRYVVQNAHWQPLYDVRLFSEKGNELNLTMLAQITQHTGEDWDDVALTLSTARPALNQQLPELRPWYLDVWTPPVITTRSMRAKSAVLPAEQDEMMPMMMASAPMPPPAPDREAEVATAQISTTQNTVTYRIAANATIATDGMARKVTIGRYTLACDLDFLTIPKQTAAVYRRVTLQNSTPSPLLAGGLNLFVDDEFIGTNQLAYTPQGDEIKLLLGVEDRITVNRELLRRQVDKRFLRDNRTVQYGYKITLKNLLSTPAKVTIQDQLPVSRHEQIKVKLDTVRPEPQEKSDLNLFTWKFSLPAGNQETVSYEYTVEHPRDLTVAGLID